MRTLFMVYSSFLYKIGSFIKERKKTVVKVTKDEAKMLREHCTGLEITRTMVQHSDRHIYYCPETRLAMELLKDYREGMVAEHYE